MKFVYPQLLVLVALVPLVGVFWTFLKARAERRLSALAAPALARRLLPQSPRLFGVQAALLLAGLALVAFAAARPQWGHSAEKFSARSRNVVVALDVSRSMLASDVRPNRLERAKADVADLIDSLEGDRCALVAFRHAGVLLCPLTSDHGFLRQALEAAAPESAPRGETDLGSAVNTALTALDPAADDHNAIILISDGGDLRGNALAAAANAKKRNVPVFTVGLGNPRRDATIPDAGGVQTFKGEQVKTRLEEAPLKAIAAKSGGRYVPLATAGTAETTLGAIYRRFLRQVAAKEQAEEEELRATERFGLFLVPGLLLVLVAGCLSRGRFAGARGRKLAAALALAIATPSFAQTVAGPVNPNAPPTNAAPSEVVLPEGDYRAPETAKLTDGEIWNLGVEAFRTGNWTNALATLRDLTLSKTHGARASELVGAVEYEMAIAAAKQRDHAAAASLLGDSAVAMRDALRANPDDARANRNFTRSLDRLPELREAAHVDAVLKAAQGKDPGAILGGADKEAQALMIEAAGVLTNPAPVAVAKSEALARRAKALADAWIPVKEAIAQAAAQNATNQQQLAYAVGEIESARDATKKSADALADMEPDAVQSLASAENSFRRFWKLTVFPPDAIAEDIVCQTNAFIAKEPFNGRAWQPEALEFTRAFRARFPAWAQQYEQQAQVDTNKPPFTKEQQDEISALATEVEKLQIEMTKTELPPKQQTILAKLERIRELLPKDKNGGGQNQQQQQQQNQDQNKDQNQNQDQQQQDQNDQKQDQQQQEQKAEQKQEEPKDDKEVEALLQKAQDRSDEHENAKKARMQKAPLAPNERDW